MNKCEWCEGKGYYNLSASYDDVHSRIVCDYCMGDKVEIKEEEYDWNVWNIFRCTYGAQGLTLGLHGFIN